MKFLIYLQLGSNTKLLREITWFGIFRIVQDRPVLVLGLGPAGFEPVLDRPVLILVGSLSEP